MKRVKFIKSCAPYSSGEIAMFEDDKSDLLVEKGMAVHVTTDKSESLKKRKRRSLGENRQVTTD